MRDAGAARKPLTAANLVRDFGPGSGIAGILVRLLYRRLAAPGSRGTEALFGDWLGLFRLAAGHDPAQLRGWARLAEMYGLGGDADPAALLFAVHTYYALLLKLVAAEAARVHGAGEPPGSGAAGLSEAYARGGAAGLGEALGELEDGSAFRRLLRVGNFPGDDRLAWYLNELDAELGGAVAALADALSGYAVVGTGPAPAGDPFRELYQALIPGELRRGLGEFYTPDWLAELLLDEVGLGREDLEGLGREDPEGPLRLRVLDPACGSGTFLALHLARLRAYAGGHRLTDELARYVLDNVVGYDLNPLAVLAAKTNYLLAVADLLPRAGGPVEIPIHLADSLIGEAPAAGKFDYVVGNPPWTNVGNLPRQYREALGDLWERYGMLEGIVRFKGDLSTLFLVRSFDLYLRRGGQLGFLLTFAALKVGAGASFRRFLAYNTRVRAIHDLVILRPFEGATNRTGAVIVEKVCELDEIRDGRCPDIAGAREANARGVRHVVWAGGPADPRASLAEVLGGTRRHEMLMAPVDPRDPASPWMQATPRAAEVVRRLAGGEQHYRAHMGVQVALNQVYFVRIVGRGPGGNPVIANPPEPGQRKRVVEVEAEVEPDALYPTLRGRNVRRWCAEPEGQYVLVPHDPRTARPIPEDEMRARLPLTYGYLLGYRDELVERSTYRSWGRGTPFYSIYDVGAHTFAPYKVVWGRISGNISGKATAFGCAVVEPAGGRPVVPDHTLVVVATGDRDEAHYIAGALNSLAARAAVASFAYELGLETQILRYVRIPGFDPRDPLHARIAELSERAHALARRAHCSGEPDPAAEGELGRVEGELDAAAAQLFGLSAGDLAELRALMAILSGGGRWRRGSGRRARSLRPRRRGHWARGESREKKGEKGESEVNRAPRILVLQLILNILS